MGLKSLSCVTYTVSFMALSRLQAGAHGPQEVVRLAARTFEFNHENLAFCQQFSALVTTNFLELSHVNDPFSLHRKPAFDSVTAPTQRAIYVRRNRCGHLAYVRGAVGSHAPPRGTLRRGCSRTLASTVGSSPKGKPLVRTMTQTRGVFRNPRTLCKVFSAAQNSCVFLSYPV